MTNAAEGALQDSGGIEEWAAKFMSSGRRISYRRVLVKITRNALTTLFLSQACYWQQKMGYDSWWWKTAADWQDELGLTRREFQKCRTQLEKLSILETKVEGSPPRVHWRVRFDRIMQALEGVSEDAPDLHNGVQIDLHTVVQTDLHNGVQIHHHPSDDSSEYTRAAAAADDQSAQTSEEPSVEMLAKASSSETTPDLPGEPTPDNNGTYVEVPDKWAKIRQKAAEKAAKASGALGRLGAGLASGGSGGRRGGVSSRRRRNRREPDAFERAEAEADDDARRHDPIARELSKRESSPEPGQNAPFKEIEAWARDRARLPRRRGGGIKNPDEWVGRDIDHYLIDLVSRALPDCEAPDSTGRSRGQGKNLIVSVTGDRARDLVAYCVENWDALRGELKLESPAPTCGIILGYLESIKALKSGKPIKKHSKTGANRMATPVEYDAMPDSGW